MCARSSSSTFSSSNSSSSSRRRSSSSISLFVLVDVVFSNSTFTAHTAVGGSSAISPVVSLATVLAE